VGAFSLPQAGGVYVTAGTGYAESSVDVYSLNANGNVPPIATLSGRDYFRTIVDVALDASRKIWVNQGGPLAEFAPGSNGDPSPEAEIEGSYTMLCGCGDNLVALDTAGNIYTNDNEAGSILVFAAGSNGNVAPIREIAGAYTQPTGLITSITLSNSGQLYVSEYAEDHGGSPTILVFAAGANGNVAPIRTISGSNTGLNQYGALGLALDGNQVLYVANSCRYGCVGSDSIVAFAKGANGNATPIRTISGAYTGLATPESVAVHDGLLYVANTNAAASGTPSITVYHKSANGDVAPLRTITGPYTGMVDPVGIAVR
jgi:hypothetical protein